MIELS